MTKIIILGGGFAGVEAAIQLSKNNYDVLLISDRPYLFVYPISIWIPVRKKKFDEVAINLDLLAKKHGFKVLIDKVLKIEPSTNEVILQHNTLQYNYLLIAMGMSKLKLTGMEHTHSICGQPEESLVIADILDDLTRKGKGKIAIGFGSNPKDITATSVRGGPAFELLFNISHYLEKEKFAR